MTKPTVASLKDKLLQPGFQPLSPAAQRFSDPIADTPMVLIPSELITRDNVAGYKGWSAPR